MSHRYISAALLSLTAGCSMITDSESVIADDSALIRDDGGMLWDESIDMPVGDGDSTDSNGDGDLACATGPCHEVDSFAGDGDGDQPSDTAIAPVGDGDGDFEIMGDGDGDGDQPVSGDGDGDDARTPRDTGESCVDPMTFCADEPWDECLDGICQPLQPPSECGGPWIVNDCIQIGVCFRMEPLCMSDEWICAYDRIPDYEEIETTCDGEDNDCDGTIDEGCVLLEAGKICNNHYECLNYDCSCDNTCPFVTGLCRE